MQTQSHTFTVLVNFEYDKKKTDLKKAIQSAIDLAFNPNMGARLDHTDIKEVVIYDACGAGEMRRYDNGESGNEDQDS